jgi:hypothetical protein
VQLTQRLGIVAGVLLVLVFAYAMIPRVVVHERLQSFESRLHDGMTKAQVVAAISASGLVLSHGGGDELSAEAPPPWRFGGSPCSDDYLVIVRLANGRLTRWSQIRESLCLKG